MTQRVHVALVVDAHVVVTVGRGRHVVGAVVVAVATTAGRHAAAAVVAVNVAGLLLLAGDEEEGRKGRGISTYKAVAHVQCKIECRVIR